MTCVSQGTTNYDVDGDRDNDYCYEREWWDCKTDSQCPSNQWCTGSGGLPKYDCVADLGLCDSCSRSAQCASGTTCISGKCSVEDSESGLCYNDKDDDCDGPIDFEDSDCCGVEGASCSSDSMCCGAVPCDNPVENACNKCGCPSPMTWNDFYDECRYPPAAACVTPPSNCNTNPYQAACIRWSPFPFSSNQACCEDITYGGTTYYDWDTAHITTY